MLCFPHDGTEKLKKKFKNISDQKIQLDYEEVQAKETLKRYTMKTEQSANFSVMS